MRRTGGIPGFANAEGTGAYRGRQVSRADSKHFRIFEDLTLSSLGIGTYLGGENALTDRLYRDAVVRAVELGANVIDTAINYRHQRSERAIGEALAALVGSGRLKREEIVVATKGGFIPFDGSVPADVKAYFAETYLRSGLIRPNEIAAGCHCMTPRYLEDQIERSRHNLGLETLDVYYLHNPETQLPEVGRAAFLGRMREAFAFLESAVDSGRIRRYGTATWSGYRQSRDASDYLSLAELEALAREVAGERHHFRIIQLPYNLAMTEAFTHTNQVVNGQSVSTLEAARRLGIYVCASVPLYQGQLTQKLPAVTNEFLPGLETNAQRALQFVRSTPGVGTALVGMKQAFHVEENLIIAEFPPVPWSDFRRLFQDA
ncbi:MAG: aldo/keto reductase [Candidatus Methylomirabilia bacterium]